MEGQRAIVLKLGEIVTNSQTKQAEVKMPGLHFKTPFITTARDFSVRLQTTTEENMRFLTKEKKYVVVSYFAKWRIDDLPLFFTRTGGYEVRAQQLLKQNINDAMRAAFGNRDIVEVISGERFDLMRIVKSKVEKSAKDLGIQIADVRVMGIDLPKAVRETVFNRMSKQREQVAMRYRARGRATEIEIKAAANRQVVVDLATARAKAQTLRASGDETAGKIYSDAYSKDPGFYALYRSLEAYRNVFDNKGTVMVLRPQGQFFKYFNNKK